MMHTDALMCWIIKSVYLSFDSKSLENTFNLFTKLSDWKHVSKAVSRVNCLWLHVTAYGYFLLDFIKWNRQPDIYYFIKATQ